MAAVLKVTHQDQMFRVQLSESCVTYDGVQGALQKLFPSEGVVAKYLDEEGDVCTLCPASFHDFVSLCSEHNGKKILKLTVAVEPSTSPVLKQNSEADFHAAEMLNGGSDWSSMLPVAFMKAGMGMFKSLRRQAFKAHHENCHCAGRSRLKQAKLLVWQLHKSDALNETSMAALGIHFLPQLISQTLECREKIDWIFSKKRHAIGPVLEDLRVLVTKTPGLQQCEGSIARLMSDKSNKASETLLVVLTALDTLPVDQQSDFLKAFYRCQDQRLHAKLAKADARMHWWPAPLLQHAGVTCDGCGEQPLKGLRFKCKACPDYDLCAECFTKKASIHDGACSSHCFDLVNVNGEDIGKGKGKAMCIAKGMLKGKGKGKCWHKGFFDKMAQKRCFSQFTDSWADSAESSKQQNGSEDPFDSQKDKQTTLKPEDYVADHEPVGSSDDAMKFGNGGAENNVDQLSTDSNAAQHLFDFFNMNRGGIAKGKGKGKCMAKGMWKGKGKGKFWNKGLFNQSAQTGDFNMVANGCDVFQDARKSQQSERAAFASLSYERREEDDHAATLGVVDDCEHPINCNESHAVASEDQLDVQISSECGAHVFCDASDEGKGDGKAKGKHIVKGMLKGKGKGKFWRKGFFNSLIQKGGFDAFTNTCSDHSDASVPQETAKNAAATGNPSQIDAENQEDPSSNFVIVGNSVVDESGAEFEGCKDA